MSRTKLVAGNWKMNGTEEQARSLATGIVAGWDPSWRVDALVCPSFVWLSMVRTALAGSPIALGAQNVSEHAAGAYTGEVDAQMLKDSGCTHVLVGHSERRALYGETDEIVALKYARALRVGLTPVICVGETLQEREAGKTEPVVARQLNAVLDAQGVDAVAKGVIAYEPVWAIGTGKTASPEQADAVHRFIRSRVAAQSASVAGEVRILYGGSMKPDNARSLFAMPDIDGGLIGGASLKVQDFLAICRAAG